METKRLLLRNHTENDFDALYEIMFYPEKMSHDSAPFDETRTKSWITYESGE